MNKRDKKIISIVEKPREKTQSIKVDWIINSNALTLSKVERVSGLTFLKYSFKEISKADAEALVFALKPVGFLMLNNKLYYTLLDEQTYMYNLLFKHCCATCTRLSSDPVTGCKKVFDGSISFSMRYMSKNFNEAFYNSAFLWKYPSFIKAGFQTFNTNSDIFSISNCLNYEFEDDQRGIPMAPAKKYAILDDFFDFYKKS